MSERDIQRAIILALSEEFHPAGVFWTNDTAAAWSMDTKRVVHSGCKGAPDVVGCLCGRFIGIEVKKATGRQSDDQKRSEQAILKTGGISIVARSPEDTIRGIRAHFSQHDLLELAAARIAAQ